MPVSFEKLNVGDSYDRNFLADLWGYKTYNAIGRGIITPSGTDKIILFVTYEKQDGLTQYNDHFVGDSLHMDGETSHTADKRLANAAKRHDHIHLFFRAKHHSPFEYHGEVSLTSYTLNRDTPSHFVFDTVEGMKKAEAVTMDALLTEEVTHGITELFGGDEEGKMKLRLHVTYERSPKNRAAAIKFHGTKCLCCGFDFNKIYGPKLARDYIEIHHITSITQTSGVVDPKTDLAPLCSNCHSMVHRQTGEIIAIERLREFMISNGWKPS